MSYKDEISVCVYTLRSLHEQLDVYTIHLSVCQTSPQQMYHTADSFKQFLDSSHFFFKVGASFCIKKQQYPVEKEQSYI